VVRLNFFFPRIFQNSLRPVLALVKLVLPIRSSHLPLTSKLAFSIAIDYKLIRDSVRFLTTAGYHLVDLVMKSYKDDALLSI
jgi:hypothetical protein